MKVAIKRCAGFGAALGLTLVVATGPGCALVELGDEDPAADASADGNRDGNAEGSTPDGQVKPDGTTPPPDSGTPVDATVDTTVVVDSGTDSGTSVDTGTADVQPQPGCADGIKNGSETDVDCGGSCSKCGSGKTCSVAGDCVSATCAAGNRCAHIVTVGPNGNKTFSPATLTIKAGDTVKFVWSSGGHNVVGGSNCNAAGGWCAMNDTNCAGVGTFNTGATYTHTFSGAGSYPFFCAPHCNQMTGTITAQ